MQALLPRKVRVTVDTPAGSARRGTSSWSRRWPAVVPIAVAAGVAVCWWRLDARADPDPAAGAPLAVTSTPSTATVVVDDRELGRTPTTVRVPPGQHRIVVRHEATF